MSNNPFGSRAKLETRQGPVDIYRIGSLESIATISRLPYSIKVLLEAALRQCDGFQVLEEDIETIARWGSAKEQKEIPFKPARVVMQDFTGVPAIVDLAALRSATARLGGDPKKINPVIPVDLVIDHSIQVDASGSGAALAMNTKREFERNRERYEFLRWGATAFENLQVVPPSNGIVHQVNLEFLANVVQVHKVGGVATAYPDSLVGTDSHTTMINGLGVVGWGVGGIEAEACMLAQPLYMLMPEVVGFRLTGELPRGTTATDLVLTVTEKLREHGVVGKFVEFFGPGLSKLSLADRATLANMAPEYGATMGFFPVDDETLNYLRGTGRSDDLVDLVERYTKEQGLFRADGSEDPVFTDTLGLDMSTVEACIAGPKRPQDRINLTDSKAAFSTALESTFDVAGGGTATQIEVEIDGKKTAVMHGSIVIAAITSCTNTSNPSVMLSAGLLAKKACERGLTIAVHVKTSLAPGSRVVTNYLNTAGLTPYLDELGFQTVGYGCTTCIGNSGPLPDPLPQVISDNHLVAAAVLSGNRNFEGRISPHVRANYLASPPLVVAYALAGSMDIDLTKEPLGKDSSGEDVYLQDIWPTQDEVRGALAASITPEMFEKEYGNIFDSNEEWNNIPVSGGELYDFQDESTYIREPSFFEDLTLELTPIQPVEGARCLALLGSSVTTDHISPAGVIPEDGPAGKYLVSHGVERRDFNSFGSRRGNHEVMIRGTFANIRMRNQLVPGTEGGYTVYFPTGEETSIYDAAEKYIADKTPLIIIAGKEYGTGSSRDWAAKGTMLLGVKAVIAESYERIHRSNLIGMGVIPFEFVGGQNAESLGLTGKEMFDIEGIDDSIQPRQEFTVRAKSDGDVSTFSVRCRIDTPVEVDYVKNGGILHTVLRSMLKS